MKINLIVLASGFSKRFEGNKLLYPIKGKSLIEYTLQKIPKNLFNKIIIVTQYMEINALAINYGYHVEFNHESYKGISSSIKLGTQASMDCDYVMFIVADMPNIQREVFEKLLNNIEEDKIISACVDDILINPMIFPKKYFNDLLKLEFEQGGKTLLKMYPYKSVKFAKNLLIDIDRKEDIQKVEKNG